MRRGGAAVRVARGWAAVVAVSRATGLPVSRLFERLQTWPGVRRPTLLLDFASLGLLSAWLLVGGVAREWRDMLEAWLVRQPGVNTVQRVTTEAGFLVEIVAPTARAVEAFVDRLHVGFSVGHVRLVYVLSDVVREGYRAT